MFTHPDGIILHDLNLGKSSVFSWEIEGWLEFHPHPIPRQLLPQYKTQIWIVFLPENGCDIGALDPGGGDFVLCASLCVKWHLGQTRDGWGVGLG